MTDQNVRRLRRLDCCAVSDALDKLDMPGVVSGLPQRSGTGRIAGRAVTVKLGTGAVPPGPPVHLGCTAIEQAGDENVIVVEQRSGIDAGCWGGLLSLAAKVRGVAGVVADGPVRDIDEAVACDLPVFCAATTARTARGRVVEKGTNVPVRIGDITVDAGDYVIADNSAVIVIRAADIERVLDVAETIVAKEAAMAKAILAGTPVGRVMDSNYEHMLK
ncbi:RraA family protein [Burkholderia sp. PU8-34]